MAEAITISKFRQQAGPYFSAAVRHHAPLAITRGSEDIGILLGSDEVWALLTERSFSPKVLRAGDGEVNIWLPEFAIYGQGATYAAAKADLLDEVRVYVAEYLDNSHEYLRAPNRAPHLSHVIKAFVADLKGELESLIFPSGPPAGPSTQTAAAAAATR